MQELITKTIISDEHQIAGEILKAFVLKCTPLDDIVVNTFAAEAIRDNFLPSEIKKACEDVVRDSKLRKIIYADIYEAAVPLRRERLRKIEQAIEAQKRQEILDEK